MGIHFFFFPLFDSCYFLYVAVKFIKAIVRQHIYILYQKQKQIK